MSNEADLLAELHLWPYRSLPKTGFVWFIAATSLLILLPLLVVLGSPILWGLLPFFLATIAGIWWAIQRSYHDGSILEEFRLWHDRVRLVRHNPRSPAQSWEANPFWVELKIHPNNGPTENYLTLKGNGREVEIGAFLTSEERSQLYEELRMCLSKVRG
jgi:uncharacterized membrane protein